MNTRPLLLLLCAFCWLLASGCQELSLQKGAESQVYQQYEQGLRLFRKKKHSLALKSFLKLQSKHPDQLELMYNIGATYLAIAQNQAAKDQSRQKNFDKAERYLKNVLDKGSAALRHKAHYNLGVLYAKKKQLESSYFHFQSAASIAKNELKKVDPDADKNKDLLSMLLRQRDRKRQELNRTRVFRYEPKLLTLTAAKEYKQPLKQIALKATFTHKASNEIQHVWGYPIGGNRWQIRFVPTRSGKWKYSLRTIATTLAGSKEKTKVDSQLRDAGLFKVLPSARAGHLVIAHNNHIRLAWKKKQDKLKLKKKNKKKEPKGKQAQKKPKKKEPKKIVRDEKILRWNGLAVPGLFGPKVKPKDFARHAKLLRSFAPTALHVDFPLDKIFDWKQGYPTPNETYIKALQGRLKALRRNPTDRWAFVYELQTAKALPTASLRQALRYIVARFGHVDQLWSLKDMPAKTLDTAVDVLLKEDPYSQPIAVQQIKDKWKTQYTIMSAKKKLAQTPKKAKKPASKTKKTAKDAKKTAKKKPLPPRLRFLQHTIHPLALGRSLQKRLTHPWIADIALPKGVSQKGLMRLWWQLYMSGVTSTLQLKRLLNTDESKTIETWLRKAQEQEQLPLHPQEAKKKQKAKDKKTTTSSKKAGKQSSSKAGQKRNTTQKGSKQPAKRNAKPKDTWLSNAFLHYAIVRHRWSQFLDSIRFSGFIKPDMVRVRVPDNAPPGSSAKPMFQNKQSKAKQYLQRNLSKALRIKDQKLRKKVFQQVLKRYRALLKAEKRQTTPSSRPSSKPGTKGTASQPSSKPTAPKVKFKDVGMRGFLASNGLTTLFLAPSSKFKNAPMIRWRDSRWDLDFVWYNALTGKYLKKKQLHQVTSLALTAPKKEAHVAKVMVQDHPLHKPYLVRIPQKLLKMEKDSPWRARGWQLMVQPPKGPKQILSLLRGPKGYEARFRPDVQGIWSFYILRKNKRLDGIWKFPGKLKVVPSKLPGPIGVHPRTRKHFISKNRPFFFFAKPVPALLSPTWSHKAFEQTLAALQNRYIGASVLHIDLPLIPWKNAADKRPFKASRPIWSNAAELVLSMIEKRLSALHEKGFQISLGIDPAHWQGVSKKEQMARLKYLLDRFGTAYPLLWFVDLRKRGKLPKKGAPMAWMKQVFTMWYRLRYPLPAPSKNPRKGRRVLTPPPMLGALMGAPRSEKELKQIAPAFDMLWFDVKSLLPALKNFKLYAFKKPVILTWQPMLEKDFTFITKKKTKKGAAKNRQLLRWARFLWQSHLFGFSHAGRPITAALHPLDPKKQTKWKPAASERVPAMMRAFFQTFDWTQMVPMLKSVKVKSYQAFGAETPFNPKGKNKQHHLVLWSRATVRRQLEVKRNFPLKKHRYIWLDPLTGKRPLSAQLLPPMPTNKQPDKMEVPFRPAILYIFRRPPQRGRKNQQRQQRKQKKQQKQLSKRQQIRNRLRRMQEDRNKFLRKLLKKQKPKSVSGKRG